MLDVIKEFQCPYRWLSNFWSCEVEYEGLKYPTVEHAYQAAKCSNPLDRQRILHESKTPGDAKRLGRRVAIRSDWESVKQSVMLDLLRKKFKNPELRKMLVDTGNVRLEEGNRWGDEFWGVNLRTGKGKNWLGILLMKIRLELREIENDKEIC